MRLPRPFYQLPVLFDVARLQAEVAGLPDAAWAAHPDGVVGNSAARLITVGGAQTDAHHGQMLPTPWLNAMPYLRQVLAGFGVVWSRSRLMRLAPGTGVPLHADINHHWHKRVRLHIPVFTDPQVRFHCGGEDVHMAAGEAWIFDNWRPHRVDNPSASTRIHLVADTTGTAAFWRFACGSRPPRAQWPVVPWQQGKPAELMTERDQREPVMAAAELELLIDDLRSELSLAHDAADATARLMQCDAMLEDFVQDWRQLCALHGTDGRSHGQFQRLAEALRHQAPAITRGIVMQTNGASAMLVLEKRVLDHLVTIDAV
jgi:hypothetical protein